MIAASVTPAVSGAAAGGVPAGSWPNRSKMTGARVTGISMMIVLDTVGVRMRRRRRRRRATLNSGRAEISTSVASSVGPPSDKAVMETAMYAAAGPISSRWPEPSRRRRVVCSIVVRPLTIRPANTAHARYESSRPALRTTIRTVTIMLASDSAAC